MTAGSDPAQGEAVELAAGQKPGASRPRGEGVVPVPPASPPAAAKSCFRPAWRELRIRRSADFEQIRSVGKRLGDYRLTLWAYPNGLPQARLGLMISRRHGGAVQRNRLKRILREAFRLAYDRLPQGLDFLCTPRPGERLELTSALESLLSLARRLAKRIREPEPRPSGHGNVGDTLRPRSEGR